MPKKNAAPRKVESIRHKDKRANIPTEELRDFVADEELAPKTMLYPRDQSLDPQLVWKGKDEQDREDLAVSVVPIYIQEKIHPQAIIDALPRAEQVSNFHCVTGWSVPNVRWGGVRFHDLLALAQPLPSAKAIRFVSLEQPYNDSLSLDQALLPNVMLAYDMDGQPLSRPHGAPARVVIPEMYGYKGVKWLTRMELVDHQPTGYWEGLGYDQNAWVGRSNGYGT